MQIQPTNHKQSNNTNFGALKSIKCVSGSCKELPCNPLEKGVIYELKNLANVDKFFKENDVKAKVKVEKWLGAEVRLAAKPVAKNFFERVINLFKKPKIYAIKDYNKCPEDSAYMIARKLRNITEKKESFSSVFSKKYLHW